MCCSKAKLPCRVKVSFVKLKLRATLTTEDWSDAFARIACQDFERPTPFRPSKGLRLTCDTVSLARLHSCLCFDLSSP